MRLLIVGLLIYPFPIAMAVEQTETESFNADGTNQTDLVFDYSYDDNRNICWNRLDTYSGHFGTTGQSLNYNTCYASDAVLRMTFQDDYISSAGFNLGAADNTWYVTWNYSDGTSSSKNSYSAHNSGYETVSHTAPTDKYIESVDVEVDDYVLLDDITWTYDDGITAGVGAPTNLTVSANLHNGSITVDWDAPANTYQYSPERYAIGFDKADPPSYAVASGNVGDSIALNTEYTFSKSYLTTMFPNLSVGDTLYFKIRSDNDTNSSYSSWTTIASYTIQDVASGPSEFSIQNTSYEGLEFSWTATDTGWASLDYYKISYKLSSEETYTDIQITDTTATSYTIEDISAGTYDFNLYACTDSGFCHGAQAGPANNFVVNANTATTTTTIVYTLGPPMNTEASNVYDTGVRVKWDAPNTGNATATSYELYYRTSAEDEIKIENITETEYTIPYANIPNGTYEFSIRAFDSVNNVYSGYSTEPTLEVFNQKAQDDADAAEAARKAEEARIAAEKAEQERLAELQRQRDKNFSETGYYETDQERSDREYSEEQDRLAELQRQRDKNAVETGYPETDEERADREYKEELEEAEVKEELQKLDVDLPEDKVEEYIEVVKEVEEFVEDLVIEEEVIEIPEEIVIIVEEEVIDEDKEEPVQELVQEITEEQKVVVDEEVVEIIEEVLDVGVENIELVSEDVLEVVDTYIEESIEQVDTLTEEQTEQVAEVLGFEDTKDVEIIAEAVKEDVAVAKAVDEFVERAVENKDVEDYTLADAVVEVQIEEFLIDPIGSFTDIDIDNIDLADIGNDMTDDQKEKAQEVVVPVIIASQIVASVQVAPVRIRRRI